MSLIQPLHPPTHRAPCTPRPQLTTDTDGILLLRDIRFEFAVVAARVALPPTYDLTGLLLAPLCSLAHVLGIARGFVHPLALELIPD
jgi:hypothetical protein